MPDKPLAPPTPITARRSHHKKPAPIALAALTDEDAAIADVLAKIEPVDLRDMSAADLPDRDEFRNATPRVGASALEGVPAAFTAGLTAEEGPDEDDEPAVATRRTNFDEADSLDDVGRMTGAREFIQAGPEILAMHRNADGDRPARAINLDGLATALGAKRWRDAPVYDWCRMKDGRRHTFSKCYFEQGVLVDIFAARTPTVAREIAEKRAAIARYNTSAERGFGYLPTVRGSIIPLEFITAALAGEVLDLTQQQFRHDVAPVKFDEYAAAGGDVYEIAKMRGVVS